MDKNHIAFLFGGIIIVSVVDVSRLTTMKYLILILTLIVFLLFINIAQAEAPAPVVKTSWTKQDVLDIIKLNAEAYNVSYDTMVKVVACESSFQRTIRGDGGESVGLVQIYLKAHPTVTVEEAENPDFAINFLAYHLSKGNGKIWTCYRNLL